MQEMRQLLEIMARLRDPKSGCPWDVEQDFASIAPYTLEEAYEVVDAIERGNMADLREELGDLLLQVVFHSQMAAEAGLFTFDDVARAINEKMIRRHPHIPLPLREVEELSEPYDSKPEESSLHPHPKSKISASPTGRGIITAQDQIENWERIKAEEKRSDSVMDEVPAGFPALLRAQKLGKKASKKGFDWDEIEGVLAKVEEELGELREAIADNSNIEEELGDLLFAATNIARHTGLDAETALRKANRKFEARFRAIEPELGAEQSLEEKEALWEKVKQLASE